MDRDITLRIVLESPPAGVDFGIQKGRGSMYETIETQRSTGGDLVFEFSVVLKMATAGGSPDFGGPIVQGPRGGRFVYVDIGTLSWTPIAGALLEPFLKEAQRRRLLDRVMFGTDQMRWPEAITMAIDHVNRLDFLTLKEKEGLFYGNAAKFLGLTPEEIARHHGR